LETIADPAREPAPLDLAPLPYHRAVVDYLKREEPAVWAWASSIEAQQQQVQDVRASLLRGTYRLGPDSHARVHAACDLARERLGIDAPATLYQGEDGGMNAMLCCLPGEVHVVLQGPVLERLDDDELQALFGHELAHFRLWQADGGDFLVADRILQHTLADPGATASHAETARLYGLHTEIYADRGAALAARSSLPAISTLVKVHTGIGSVDPAASLRQAEQLAASDDTPSRQVSHPEAFLRARAVHGWWNGDTGIDAWLHQRLRGCLAWNRLDLVGQVELTALTRGLLASALTEPVLAGERGATQVRQFFPEGLGGAAPLAPEALAAARVDEGVRTFAASLLLDLALADPDAVDEGLLAAVRVARTLGVGDELLAALRRDAGWSKRELDRMLRKLGKGA
jgi:hypothetical protein